MTAKRTIIGIFLLVFLSCSGLGWAGLAVWPDGWSDLVPLFPTQFHGERFEAVHTLEGTSLLTAEGTYHRELSLVYRHLQEFDVVSETILVDNARIQHPLLLTSVNGNRHVLWKQWDSGKEYLTYAVLSFLGELLTKEIVLESESVIQDPAWAIINDSIHLVWADNNDRVFQIKHGILEPSGLRIPSAVTFSANTSVRPSIVGDHLGGLHVVWVEVGQRGAEVMYAQKQVLGWSEPLVIGRASLSDVQHGGGPALQFHEGLLYAVWTADPLARAEREVRLSVLDINGNMVVREQRLASGFRPTLFSGSNLNVLWQTQERGSLQVYYAKLRSAQHFSKPLLLSASTVTAMRPVGIEDGNGDIRVFWFGLRNQQGTLFTINTLEPRPSSLLRNMGIDDESPFSHLFLVVVGAVALFFSQAGLNMLILVLTFAAGMILSYFPHFGRCGVGYKVLLMAACYLILEETPLALGAMQPFGDIHYLLAVGLSMGFTWVILRKSELDRGFEEGAILGLWFFWYSFMLSIPQALYIL